MVAAIMNGREKEKEMRNWLADLNVDYEKASFVHYFRIDFQYLDF